MPENNANVYKKIALVMRDVGAIEKDSRHQQGFSYQSIQAVSARLNRVMSEHQLIILPSVSDWHIEDNRYIIEYSMLIVDAESGDSIERTWLSEAMVNGTKKDGTTLYPDDKALGKAHSYALKYFTLRLFMVSAEDDSDGDSTDTTENTPTRPKQNKQRVQQQQPKPKNWTHDQAQIEYAKNEGRKLNFKYGEETVERAKNAIKKAHEYNTSDDYIAAIVKFLEPPSFAVCVERTKQQAAAQSGLD